MRHPLESRLTSRPAPLSVIVVAGDPEEAARVILVARLAHGGYRFRLAGTGDDLLREARADDVGLVIAEVDLPCAGGPCVVEVLRRTPELRHIPVLAYSARARGVGEAQASWDNELVGDAAQPRGALEVVAAMHAPGAVVPDVGDPR